MNNKRVDRIKRISYEIQRKIAIIIQQKIKDPRVGSPTIAGVEISKDLKNAKIFITFLDKENPEEIRSSVLILQKASSFIRYLLAHSINLRVVPVLYFKYDSSLINGFRISGLISKLKIN